MLVFYIKTIGPTSFGAYISLIIEDQRMRSVIKDRGYHLVLSVIKDPSHVLSLL